MFEGAFLGALVGIVLNALDVWFTDRVLTLGGRERNPVMRWAFEKFGFQIPMAIKMVLGTAAFAVCAALSQFAFGLVTGVYLYVCWNNWNVWQRLKEKAK